MEFEGQFKVRGTPDEVIARLSEVERVAKCIPGASLDGQEAEGTYLGSMRVAFGPKIITFKGKASCAFDLASHSGVVRGWANSNLRNARIQIHTVFRVQADPQADIADSSCIVAISSNAELGGPLAVFARTGGVALGNELMKDFERRLAEEFADRHLSTSHAAPVSFRSLLAIWVRGLWLQILKKLRWR